MRRFHQHIQEMELEFDNSVQSTFKLNQFLYQYEQTLHRNYIDPNTSNNATKVYEAAIVDAVTEFPNEMCNPFKVMVRWVKFEILDIEAILEAIDKKNTMLLQEYATK